MDAEIIVFNALKHLCSSRVFPDHLPDETKMPAIRYTLIGGQIDGTNCGIEISPRVQIDIYANTVKERHELEEKVAIAMVPTDEYEPSLQVPAIHSYSYENKAYVSTLDYLIL